MGETTVCISCGAAFPRTNQMGPPPKRCSPCEREQERLRSQEKRHKAREQQLASMGPHTKIRVLDCAICERLWIWELTHAGAPPKFCSESCRRAGRRNTVQRYERSAKGRERKAEQVARARRQRFGECKECSSTFAIEIGSHGAPSYCSEECRRVALLRRKRRDEAKRRQCPEVIEAHRRRQATEEYREKNRLGERRRLQDPDYRERKNAWGRTPEARERARRKRETAEAKAARSAYYSKQWQDPHYRERKREQRRRRYHTNPDFRARVHARNAARLALTRGAPGAEQFTLDEIFERDAGVCHLCGEECPRDRASMDHIIPVSKGGPHTRANVKLAHIGCNSRKNDRLLHELTWYQPDTET